ncbi:signal-transduction protein [Candidatus Caldarchaeum subterraneum]|uniref:Signal-transduction protein n=1 Tax=Caldiarchaeum subterraneum TaxID=311458 RepID=E6N8C6_CALS0|nr:signal-transduction protein [Candidatus Caldarchaeum subterraneum]BAJ48607.1 signal-transduction protein [Candidatus Caldarchaeum subterraneum]BAJ49662.1 signal-transduction protein [Candidatus Caldarchaeum subterraneum]BAJ51317.1 signal-transduction protein [Candidatus Caldarchaeum subterraneum]
MYYVGLLGVKVSEIMSRRVVTAKGDEKLSDIAEKMIQSKVSSVVVVSDGKVAGIVTEKDFVKFFALRVDYDSKISDYMTREVIVVREDASLNEAKNIMVSNNIRHLPVVDRNNNLVGMITVRDIVESVETLV